MCTGNDIKSEVGDAEDCGDTCNGVSRVPNAAHTACGKLS